MAISARGMRTIVVNQKRYFWRAFMDSDFRGVHVFVVGEEAFFRGHRGQQLGFFVPHMFWNREVEEHWKSVADRIVTPAVVRRAIELGSRQPTPFTGALDLDDVNLDIETSASLFR